MDAIPYVSGVDKKKRHFLLHVPHEYEQQESERWPLILFLHGNGERGDGVKDLDYLLSYGPLYETWIQKRELPFIIAAPQLPMFDRDKQGIPYLTNRSRDQIPHRLERGVPERPRPEHPRQPMSGMYAGDDPFPYVMPPEGWERCEQDIIFILDHLLTHYRVDPNRVFLTGVSYGGFGTWFIASRHPERFAAIAPVVGWGHPSLVDPIAHARLPVWTFAGGRDSTIPPKYFYPGLARLEELGHHDVRFTIHADMEHDVWKRVYAGTDIYEWFLGIPRVAH